LLVLVVGCEDAAPTRLSQTGLYYHFDARTYARDLFTWRPRWPLWADGAEKERFLALPPGQVIDTSDPDRWVFPLGTKVWKHFSMDGRLVETRLLHKQREGEGGWFQMAYRWRDDDSDADAVPLGEKNTRGTAHDVPSQEDCAWCHDWEESAVIGLSALQLAQGPDGPLSTLIRGGRLSSPPPAEPQIPGDAPIQAALGYLHGNCGHCHYDRTRVPDNVRIFMNVRTTDRRPEDAPVYQAIGKRTRHVMPGDIDKALVPGDPDHSQLLARMIDRGEYVMPPVAVETIDEPAVAAVRAWILSLPR